MSELTKSQLIEEIAAEWAVKVDAGPLAAGEQAALDAWLDANTLHLGAFARARAALHFATPPRIVSEPQIGSDGHGRGRATTRRRVIASGSLAACVVALAGTFIWSSLIAAREAYATRVGETQVVPLSDGSVVTLNTNSAIDVQYSERDRRVYLTSGEALFDVAKDKQRPFIVVAGDTQMRAVGTSFTVRMLPDQPVQVLVREGVVEMKRPEVPAAPVVFLRANTRGTAPANKPISKAEVQSSEVSRALAWRMGRIAFEGQTLKEAVAEFARYSNTKIEIDAPDVEHQTVAGLFVSNDPVAFAKAVAASFRLKVKIQGHTVRLSR